MKPGYRKRQLLEFHMMRPPHARAADERIKAQRTLRPDDGYVDSRVKNPGAMNIEGIDTPHEDRVPHDFIERLKKAKSRRERDKIYEAEREKAPSEKYRGKLWGIKNILEDEIQNERDMKLAGRNVRSYERKHGKGSWITSQWNRYDDYGIDLKLKNQKMPRATPALKTIREEEMAGNFVSEDLTRLYIPKETAMEKPAFVKKFERALKEDTVPSFNRVDDLSKRYVRYDLGKKRRVLIDRVFEAEIRAALGKDTKAYPIDTDKPVLYKGEHGYAMVAPRIADED